MNRTLNLINIGFCGFQQANTNMQLQYIFNMESLILKYQTIIIIALQ